MRPPPSARIPDLGAPGRFGFPEAGAWERAEALPALVGAEDGRVPRAPTAVRVGGTEEAFHARFECGGGVCPCTLFARGAPLWKESVVEAFLAAGRDRPERYLEVEVNPAGAIFDAIVSNPDGDRRTMRLSGVGATRVAARAGRPGPDLWTVELAVPWLAIPGCDGFVRELRANFFRIHRPEDGPPEHGAWSPTFADPPDFHVPDRFGRLIRG